jgi:hypothetical protein
MKSQSFNDLKVTLNNCVNILDNVGIDTLNVLHDELQYVVKYAIQCEDEINNIKPMTNNINHPTHFNQHPIEVIDMMLAIYGREAVINFCLLNAFKYRMRAGHKDDITQDIQKALWYERKAKELEVSHA